MGMMPLYSVLRYSAISSLGILFFKQKHISHRPSWRHIEREAIPLFSVLRYFVIFVASYLNHHTTGDGW